jgi:hypothetical protein
MAVPPAVTRSFGPLAAVGFACLIAACDTAGILGVCTDDLLSRVEPRNRTLRVGESYVATASAWGCSGTKRLADEWAFFVADTTIARVDSRTGRVTGRSVGAIDVGARGARYGDAGNRSHVTVTQ